MSIRSINNFSLQTFRDYFAVSGKDAQNEKLLAGAMDKATMGLKTAGELGDIEKAKKAAAGLTDFEKAKKAAKSPLIGAGDFAKQKFI